MRPRIVTILIKIWESGEGSKTLSLEDGLQLGAEQYQLPLFPPCRFPPRHGVFHSPARPEVLTPPPPPGLEVLGS